MWTVSMCTTSLCWLLIFRLGILKAGRGEADSASDYCTDDSIGRETTVPDIDDDEQYDTDIELDGQHSICCPDIKHYLLSLSSPSHSSHHCSCRVAQSSHTWCSWQSIQCHCPSVMTLSQLASYCQVPANCLISLSGWQLSNSVRLSVNSPPLPYGCPATLTRLFIQGGQRL